MQPLHGWMDGVKQKFPLPLHGQPYCNVAQFNDVMRMRRHMTALSAPGTLHAACAMPFMTVSTIPA